MIIFARWSGRFRKWSWHVRVPLIYWSGSPMVAFYISAPPHEGWWSDVMLPSVFFSVFFVFRLKYPSAWVRVHVNRWYLAISDTILLYTHWSSYNYGHQEVSRIKSKQFGVLVLIACSPLEKDIKVAEQTSAKQPTISKEQAEKNKRHTADTIAFMLMIFAVVCVVVFIAIPNMDGKRLQRDLEEAACPRGRQVVEELLVEVRRLRIAVENQNRW